MPSETRTAVIVNPAAGRGRGAAVLPAIRAAFGRRGVTDIRLTTKAGDEAELARAAIADGATTLVVVGGDGTWGRSAGAVLEQDAGDRVRFAFLSAGTGNDFAKSLDAPSNDPEAMAAFVATDAERRIDAGVLRSGGRTHYFINVAGFGFDADVLERLAGRGHASGVAGYVGMALRRLLSFPGIAFTDGGPDGQTRMALMVLFANARYFGGAFRIAPDARLDDGRVDAVEIGNAMGLARVSLFIRAVRGTHGSHPRVRMTRHARYHLTFSRPAACDLDGELVRMAARDIEITTAPRALRVASR